MSSTPSQPETTGSSQHNDLIEHIKESADKLQRDGSSRGDLKILNRTLKELRYAFKVFTPYRRQLKVTMFGSSRTPPNHPTYRHAVDFGKAIADRGWLVITGAAGGIMEAGHVGAGRENSMGLNILLPFEQEANHIINGDQKLVHMKYFFTRKLMFVKECQAVVCLPGGFGTLDEALEVLTLLQTGKRDLVPLVLLDAPGGTYWTNFRQFIVAELLNHGMISPQDSYLYRITHSVEEAVNELVSFYRVFHNMRYVHDDLVFRLREAPSATLLTEIKQHFGDILAAGTFELCDALPEERDEPELAEFPRLVFSFDRRSHGRLRQLIDALNRGHC